MESKNNTINLGISKNEINRILATSVSTKQKIYLPSLLLYGQEL